MRKIKSNPVISKKKIKNNPINSSRNSKRVIYKYCERCGTFTMLNGRCINIEHDIRKGGKSNGRHKNN